MFSKYGVIICGKCGDLDLFLTLPDELDKTATLNATKETISVESIAARGASAKVLRCGKCSALTVCVE